MLQRARLVGEWSEVLLKPTIGDPWFIAGPTGGLLTVYMTLSLRSERTVKAKVGSRGKRGCIKVVGSVVPITDGATCTLTLTQVRIGICGGAGGGAIHAKRAVQGIRCD